MIKLKTPAVLALALVGWAAQAAPFFASKDGSMILDRETGLIWMRCSLGQNWDGTRCAGQAASYTFDSAQDAAKVFNSSGGLGGYTDWIVPKVRQLQSIRWCSRGFEGSLADLNDGGSVVKQRCANDSLQPTIDSFSFPSSGLYYWTDSASSASGRNSAWSVSFSNGNVGSGSGRGYDFQVRLVRSTQVSENDAATTFPEDLSVRSRVHEAKRLADAGKDLDDFEAEVRKRRSELEAADRKAEAERQAAKRRADELERVAIAAAIRKGPQQLYLLAGQAQRGKSIEINGRSFGATELYELIVEKFPTSEYAVKASDQLNAMDRSERSQAAANRAAETQRQADQNASNRAACFSGVRSCEANCNTAWSSDYRMAQSCVSRCQRTCN